MAADFTSADVAAYEKASKKFISDLEVFHQARGTPFKRPPLIGGRTVDLYLLYRKVVSLGGLASVTENRRWKDVTRCFDLPPSCTNAAFVFRQHYIRYLEAYEQVHHLGHLSDDEDGLNNDDSCAGSTSVEIRQPVQAAAISERRRSSGSQGRATTPLAELSVLRLSLLSGLQNESDVALNVCLILSRDAPEQLSLAEVPDFLEVLLAHAGVFYCHRLSAVECARLRAESERMVTLWDHTVPCQKGSGRLGYNNQTLDILEDIPCCSVLDDWAVERAIVISTILFNLLHAENNAEYLAKSSAFAQFLTLTLCCAIPSVRRLAMENMVEVSHQFVLDEGVCKDRCDLQQAFFGLLMSSDKAAVQHGLSALANLCTSNSDECFTQHIPQQCVRRLFALLMVPDVELIIGSLETLVSVSGLGHNACALLVDCNGALAGLVALLTFDMETALPLEALQQVRLRAESVPPVVLQPTDTEGVAAAWLRAHYELSSEGMCSRNQIYNEYAMFCAVQLRQPLAVLQPASFWCVLARVFSTVQGVGLVFPGSRQIADMHLHGLSRRSPPGRLQFATPSGDASHLRATLHQQAPTVVLQTKQLVMSDGAVVSIPSGLQFTVPGAAKAVRLPRPAPSTPCPTTSAPTVSHQRSEQPRAEPQQPSASWLQKQLLQSTQLVRNQGLPATQTAKRATSPKASINGTQLQTTTTLLLATSANTKPLNSAVGLQQDSSKIAVLPASTCQETASSNVLLLSKSVVGSQTTAAALLTVPSNSSHTNAKSTQSAAQAQVAAAAQSSAGCAVIPTVSSATAARLSQAANHSQPTMVRQASTPTQSLTTVVANMSSSPVVVRGSPQSQSFRAALPNKSTLTAMLQITPSQLAGKAATAQPCATTVLQTSAAGPSAGLSSTNQTCSTTVLQASTAERSVGLSSTSQPYSTAAPQTGVLNHSVKTPATIQPGPTVMVTSLTIPQCAATSVGTTSPASQHATAAGNDSTSITVATPLQHQGTASVDIAHCLSDVAVATGTVPHQLVAASGVSHAAYSSASLILTSTASSSPAASPIVLSSASLAIPGTSTSCQPVSIPVGSCPTLSASVTVPAAVDVGQLVAASSKGFSKGGASSVEQLSSVVMDVDESNCAVTVSKSSDSALHTATAATSSLPSEVRTSTSTQQSSGHNGGKLSSSAVVSAALSIVNSSHSAKELPGLDSSVTNGNLSAPAVGKRRRSQESDDDSCLLSKTACFNTMNRLHDSSDCLHNFTSARDRQAGREIKEDGGASHASGAGHALMNGIESRSTGSPSPLDLPDRKHVLNAKLVAAGLLASQLNGALENHKCGHLSNGSSGISSRASPLDSPMDTSEKQVVLLTSQLSASAPTTSSIPPSVTEKARTLAHSSTQCLSVANSGSQPNTPHTGGMISAVSKHAEPRNSSTACSMASLTVLPPSTTGPTSQTLLSTSSDGTVVSLSPSVCSLGKPALGVQRPQGGNFTIGVKQDGMKNVQLSSEQKPPTQTSVISKAISDTPNTASSALNGPSFTQLSGGPASNYESSQVSKSAFPCQWKGCVTGFNDAALLRRHVLSAHVPGSGASTICMWNGCSAYSKPRHQGNLFYHLAGHLDRLSKKPDSCVEESAILSKMAWSTILERDEEYALSATVHLSAALVLKNLAEHCATARRLLACHEPLLADIAMSTSEAAGAIAACLAFLQSENI